MTQPVLSPPHTPTSTPHPLSRGLVLLMATATGITVASNYYSQPLLHTIASEFGLSVATAGNVVTTAQLSYGAGLVLVVPLADLLERRMMIVVMTILAALGLLVSGLAPSLPWLLAGTALTGFCSVAAQILIPFAATLAAPAERGRAVGTVMGGLLIGILSARTVSGALASIGSWHTIYFAAAAVLLCTSIALRCTLPRFQNSNDSSTLSYTRLIASMGMLFVKEPVLRARALLGMLSFILFSLFWTPLAFLLSAPPYGYSSVTIGLFGLAGAAGALAASWAGRLADRGKGSRGTYIGLVGMLLGWACLWFAPTSLGALLSGVLVLDLATQLTHVSNQNAIFTLAPEARNRLNAGYMTCYFIGGSVGSWLAGNLFQHHGWAGVSLAGIGIAMLAIAVGMVVLRRRSA